MFNEFDKWKFRVWLKLRNNLIQKLTKRCEIRNT